MALIVFLLKFKTNNLSDLMVSPCLSPSVSHPPLFHLSLCLCLLPAPLHTLFLPLTNFQISVVTLYLNRSEYKPPPEYKPSPEYKSPPDGDSGLFYLLLQLQQQLADIQWILNRHLLNECMNWAITAICPMFHLRQKFMKA